MAQLYANENFPLPVVEELRQWWKTHQNRRWLFPAAQKGLPATQATSCMSTASVQEVFVLARQESSVFLPPNAFSSREVV